MIDQIIPATETPGDKGARVNEFIDVILTEWATDGEGENFLNGLAGVDKQSNELYGKDFVGATAEQQVTLLRAMDEGAMSERRVAARPPESGHERAAPLNRESFLARSAPPAPHQHTFQPWVRPGAGLRVSTQS